MISNFFINRPIAANVIGFVTIIFGLVAMQRLPVQRYPDITPPTIQVSAVYPGANAKVIADTVAAPLEQEINGVQQMIYMSSTSSSTGAYSLTVTFEVGTDLDEAQVLVQNRVALAEPLLPMEVRRQGVSVTQQSTNILMGIILTSPKKIFHSLYMTNFANLRLRDELRRVEGVGEISIGGTGVYSMRIWVDPAKLDARNLTFQDLVTQLSQQNVQVAAGQLGRPPMNHPTAFQLNIRALGRLDTPEQFENIVVKLGDDGALTYLRDVAHVELGSETYDTFFQAGGETGASLLVYQLPGANALDVAERVRKMMQKLQPSFPQGLEYSIPFDTTRFVSAAIHEVYMTLLEAGTLVLVVILVFLQDWRAVLVPATTVPITIIGAFAVMPLLGFSINLLTLFGLILAIGIVVDDAIVIVENATHHIERGLAPKEATIRAMSEVTGPVIGMTLVLMAVFIPTTFMTGITGQLYQQFALVIAFTALISAINALTLKPAQCARWLRPKTERRFFLARWFNSAFGWIERVYTAGVRLLIKAWAVVVLVFAFTVAGTIWWYMTLPTGFLPVEDQGYFITAIQLPDAASQDRTREVIEQINAILADAPGVDTWLTLGGMSVLQGGQASNAATVFIVLTDWEKRKTPELQQGPLLAKFTRQFSQIEGAQIILFPPPAIQGLGTSGGFEMQVDDRGGVGLERLQTATQELVRTAKENPALTQVNTTFTAGVPELFADIDRVQAMSLQVELGDVFETLQAALGSVYINDFNKFGRTYHVNIQADADFRDDIDDIWRLNVRNAKGGMVSLGSVLRIEKSYGPQLIQRFNLYPTAKVTGSAAPGESSGQALDLMEQLAREQFSSSIDFDWTGVSYQERKTSGGELYVFGLAVLLVYFVLAFLYESWLLPLSVILVVPLGLLGTVAMIAWRGMDNNVYVQIGVVLIIALACKNAILIVEFARDLRNEGKSVTEAAVGAAQMRFRPILMTSFAFILGVLPLAFAHGAAAASRRSVGTAVCGGMLTSTFLAVLFTPVFYVVLQRLSERFSPPEANAPVAASDQVSTDRQAN